ncbi:hypothetical protein D9758_016717 [Tetrapyrgos nigripes]|uniref:RRM domain-containing protein n=1 Tax=Tetrapyrgos nigripes TaxID=182062 RepID=A0A8H5BR97_9AGAR|nr:hypothetical protein D9758_016717 [Tetrapyrgos nigripes]
MSLSSVLLPKSKQKKGKEIDTELDALFKSTFPTERPKPAPPETDTQNASQSSPKNLKRKHDTVQADSPIPDVSTKRAKAKTEKPKHKADKKKPEAKKEKEKKVATDEDEDMEDEDEEDGDDEDNSDLENAYFLSRSKLAAGAKPKKNGKGHDIGDVESDESGGDEDEMDVDEDGEAGGEAEEEDGDDGNDDEEEDAADAPPPQHESLSSKSKKKKEKSKPKRKEKYVPEGETPEQRDARTIFIGNLSLEVAQRKSLLKAFQRHILSLIPPFPDPNSTAKPKIESTRFRSVPFSVPTSRLDGDDAAAAEKSSKGKAKSTDRSSSWKSKSSSNSNDADPDTTDPKKFLTPAQKKKIAFINHDFHSSADTIHAYIVFAHPSSLLHVPARPNLPPPPETMDPYTAARLAKEACDGSIFMERALRVDIVGKGTVTGGSSTNEPSELREIKEREQIIKTDVDPKRCIFVGSLDFESKEEDLRVFFEGVVSGVMGPRGVSENDGDGEEAGEGEEENSEAEEEEEGESDEDDEDEAQGEEEESEGDEDEDEDKDKDKDEEKKSKSSKKTQPRKENEESKRWVTQVRIIRDKDTQLGKGFAYVQFATRECVDEILALEPSKLKFAKRKLRVERCKTLPGGRSRVKLSSKAGKGGDAKSSSAKSKPGEKPGRASKASGAVVRGPGRIPKGDPNLGQKLAHLSKEERKAAKAADADRMARRLAKKKARMAMGTGLDSGKTKKDGKGKEKGKERTRERKSRSSSSKIGKGKDHGVGSAAKNKGKRRSEKSVQKRNLKK